MKEQILHLDPHDDFISTRDKMGWVQTQRVLLIWPPHGRSGGTPPLARRLDLLLLHRHAHRLGAQLALITQDPQVREHAGELGLPVFESVEATRRMRWRSRIPRVRPERHGPRPDTQAIRRTLAPKREWLPRWASLTLRGLAFVLGASACLALGSALLPSATITLAPARQSLAVTAQVSADPNQPDADPAAGAIPARRVRVEVQNTQLTPTTGSVDVPSAPATGAVVFTNLIGTPATIPVATSLRTTSGVPVRFVTLQPATIEGRLGATVQVAIRAADPGPAGNVAVGQINAIDGSLGTQLAVTNPAPTEGGAVVQRAAVAQADRDRVRHDLLAQLQSTARGVLEDQLQPGEFLAADTVTVTQVLAESFDRAVGEPTDAISLTLRIAAAGLVIHDADAAAVAEYALRAQVPPGAALTDTPLRFTRDSATRLDPAGRVQFAMTAEGDIVPRIDREQVRRLVLGQPAGIAAQNLAARLPLSVPPQISLSPDWYARWYPYLPWLWLRVHVIIQ